MILDALDHADLYRSLSPGIAAAFDFLKRTDLATLPEGKHPLAVPGVVAIVSRYQTKRPEAAVWESHRRNIDVQYVAEGRERMGYAPLSRAPAVKTPYAEEKDVIFYEPGADAFEVAAGQFTIFYPHDIHAPSLAIGEPAPVLKVVVKVPVE